MPNTRAVSPAEAKKLMDEGYTYVDVRTPQEFDLQHPAGALNIPLGPDFLPLMRRLFRVEAKIVVGCATGVRSRRAAEMLAREGFLDVADQRAGMEGARSPFGQVLERGWSAAGLPTATGSDAGSYAAVQTRSDA
jgi:rhodanese-related sulfurtransferase